MYVSEVYKTFFSLFFFHGISSIRSYAIFSLNSRTRTHTHRIRRKPPVEKFVDPQHHTSRQTMGEIAIDFVRRRSSRIFVPYEGFHTSTAANDNRSKNTLLKHIYIHITHQTRNRMLEDRRTDTSETRLQHTTYVAIFIHYISMYSPVDTRVSRKLSQYTHTHTHTHTYKHSRHENSR